jgi:hypothetical protein
MGQPYWTDGLTYARRAIELGMPQVALYYYGNLLGDPNYRGQVPELVREALASGLTLDVLPNAPGIHSQGDPTTAVGLVEAAATPRPYPEAWAGLLKNAESDLASLQTAATEVETRRDAALDAIAGHEMAIDGRRAEVEGRAQSLLDLITRITNAEATSYFDEEAKRYGGEAKWLWRGGLGVVVAAAMLAIAPVLIYYFDRITGRMPWLHGNDLVAAHATPAVALGAVAGILLARARGRDRSRQRNRDLAVALQTMFVYAEQIADVEQRQVFIRDMGRTVLEAFLRQEAPVDVDRSLLAAIRGS